jgi:hypothetical protein
MENCLGDAIAGTPRACARLELVVDVGGAPYKLDVTMQLSWVSALLLASVCLHVATMVRRLTQGHTSAACSCQDNPGFADSVNEIDFESPSGKRGPRGGPVAFARSRKGRESFHTKIRTDSMITYPSRSSDESNDIPRSVESEAVDNYNSAGLVIPGGGIITPVYTGVFVCVCLCLCVCV